MAILWLGLLVCSVERGSSAEALVVFGEIVEDVLLALDRKNQDAIIRRNHA